MADTQICQGVRTAQVDAANPREAVRRLAVELEPGDAAIVTVFCTSSADLACVAAALGDEFDVSVVVGCTTAGEIGPSGYSTGSISGFSLSSAVCAAVSGRLTSLRDFDPTDGKLLVRSLLDRLLERRPSAAATNTFAVLLVDGLSQAEEPVARALQTELGEIPLIGGSAGDDLRFQTTHVFHGGAFHTDCAVLTLISTDLPFCAFRSQHFDSPGEPFVVTAADPRHRIVYEINGLPAVQEYARLVGVTPDDLDPLTFASFPIIVSLHGSFFVRSIQKANSDGSLTFFSAIEEGLVLQISHGHDLLGNLASTLAKVREAVGSPSLMITCDCALRNLEISRTGARADIARVLCDHNAVGFSTYGEQFRGVHVNQTLVAVALGRGSRSCDE